MQEAGGFETVRGKSLKTPILSANETALWPLVGQVSNDPRGFPRLLLELDLDLFWFLLHGAVVSGPRGHCHYSSVMHVPQGQRPGALENRLTIRPPKSSLLTKRTPATSPGLGTASGALPSSGVPVPGARVLAPGSSWAGRRRRCLPVSGDGSSSCFSSSVRPITMAAAPQHLPGPLKVTRGGHPSTLSLQETGPRLTRKTAVAWT